MVDAYTKIFLYSMIDGSVNLTEFIDNVKDTIIFNSNKLHQEIKLLYDIHRFLNILFYIWSINNNKQSIIESTFGNMLLTISNKNCHNEGEYKCSFHTESLLSHLIFCMLKTIERFPSNMKNRKKLQLAIIALLHDVGKYGCTCLMHFKDKKVTGFPFHGEYGAGILIKLWHEGFSEFFGKDEWSLMCRTLAVHMCGYHETDTNTFQSDYKHTLLQLENNTVKENLYWLSYGDKEGRCADSSVSFDLNHYIAFRNTFKERISHKFDMKQFMKTYKLHGYLIQICGMSSSGKSTIVNKIKAYFVDNNIPDNAITIIERDMIMATVTCKYLNKEQPITKPEGNDYRELYEKYKEHKLSKMVNNYMSHLIHTKLRSGNIVIVDTVANYFKGSNC